MTNYFSTALLLFLKYPEAGKVKSRLAQSVGEPLALRIYEESLRLVIDNVRQAAAFSQPVIFCDPPERIDDMLKYWSPGWPVFPQRGVDLGERMASASEWAFSDGGFQSILFLGGDSPTLPVAYIFQAIAAARENPLCLGPSRDGGYWCIGMNRHEPGLFQRIHWGSDRVFQETLERAKKLSLTPFCLPEWYDIDTREDLEPAWVDLAEIKGGDRLRGLIESIRNSPD